ncbi:MAG TPA: type II toxin-antitoxin system VapC family toxin [Trebonia sp.]|jgi:predicted nucleic acid-binding protein|nr:type II toxin-antitoxin system VapC family toxin [Trebonia sp.]
MPFVVDASTTMAWCFEDEATTETDAILDRLGHDHALVPPLWEYEVANVLLVAERRTRITEFQSTRFLALLGQLPIHVSPLPQPAIALTAIGRRHRLSAYDSAYVELASREGVALASQDNKLRRAAEASGIPLLA